MTNIERWRERIESGKKYRQEAGKSDQWKEFTQMFRHDYPEDEYIVNHIFAIGKVLIPQIFLRSPKCTVTSLLPQAEAIGMVRERLNNLWLAMSSVRNTLRRACYIAYLKGTAIIKVGYDSLIEINIKNSLEAELARLVSEFEGKDKFNLRYHDPIIKNMPWIRAIHPENFIIPYWCTEYDLSDAPWCGHQMFIPLDEIKEHKDLRNLSGLGNEHTLSYQYEDFLKKTMLPGYEDVDGIVPVWELYDRFRKEHVILVEGYDKFLWNDKEWEEGFPFAPITFNIDPERFWGIPDVRIIKPQQEELNDIRQMEHDHRKRSALRVLIDGDALNEEDEAAIRSGEPMTFVRTKPGKFPQQVAMPLTFQMSRDIFLAAEDTLRDMWETTGFSRNQKGEAVDRQTATEAQIVQINTNVRMDDRKDLLSDAIKSILEKMNDKCVKYWTEEKIIDVIGPDMTPIWVAFKGRELEGKFGLHIDLYSALPNTQYQRRQDLMILFPILQQHPLFGGNQIFQMELIKMLFESFPGVNTQRLLAALGGGEQSAGVPISLSDLQGQMGALRQNVGARQQLQQMLSKVQSPGGKAGKQGPTTDLSTLLA